jgi:hypothetical protein
MKCLSESVCVLVEHACKMHVVTSPCKFWCSLSCFKYGDNVDCQERPSSYWMLQSMICTNASKNGNHLFFSKHSHGNQNKEQSSLISISAFTESQVLLFTTWSSWPWDTLMPLISCELMNTHLCMHLNLVIVSVLCVLCVLCVSGGLTFSNNHQVGWASHRVISEETLWHSFQKESAHCMRSMRSITVWTCDLMFFWASFLLRSTVACYDAFCALEETEKTLMGLPLPSFYAFYAFYAWWIHFPQ